MNKAVFLDRDGVINRALIVDGVPTPPRSIKEVEILSGAREAISLLKQANFRVVVVTNQPDVARGASTQKTVESINSYLKRELQIQHFYTCFHDDPAECGCRKPKPGLILAAAQDLEIDLHQSVMIGDRWRDIAAGQAVGCRCFFIEYGYAEKSPDLPYKKVSSLIEATKLILEYPNDTFN